jgi:purine-binding chemotaxis protein CheW
MNNTKRKVFKGTRFLCFELAGEEYCIEIKRIREILALPDITPVPDAPEYIRGVMNLRGIIIPLVDLRLKFHLPFRDYTDRTCAIVIEPELDGDPVLMGITVDEIHEVVGIPDEQINPLPYINSRIRSEYIQGFTEQDSIIRIILDIDRLLNSRDLDIAAELTENADTEEVHHE